MFLTALYQSAAHFFYSEDLPHSVHGCCSYSRSNNCNKWPVPGPSGVKVGLSVNEVNVLAAAGESAAVQTLRHRRPTWLGSLNRLRPLRQHMQPSAPRCPCCRVSSSSLRGCTLTIKRMRLTHFSQILTIVSDFVARQWLFRCLRQSNSPIAPNGVLLFLHQLSEMGLFFFSRHNWHYLTVHLCAVKKKTNPWWSTRVSFTQFSSKEKVN